MSDTDIIKSYSDALRLGLHMNNIEDNLRLTNGSTVANTLHVKMEWIESV